jgi:hypothetical protein
MIVMTRMEPQYALKNQMIGIKIDLENRGNSDKRAEIIVYVSEKSRQSVAANIFDKRDSLNTYTTEVISTNKSVDVYVPLKSGILVDRGLISYTIEIKEV